MEVGAMAVTLLVDVKTERQEQALEIRDAGYKVDETWLRHCGAGEVAARARAVMAGIGLPA